MAKITDGGRTLTPMLSQYLEIKKQYPDSILFFRLGDFYEMFFEDATVAAPVLEVQLTSRDKKSDNPVPLCGIPYHAASQYIQKLIAKGLKVAICEQTEDPATAKGLVRREVTRVITPALVGDPDLVPEEATNILACLCETHKGEIEISLLDILGGELRDGTLTSFRSLYDLISRVSPKEILIVQNLSHKKWFQDLLKFVPRAVVTERTQYFSESGCQVALLKYLSETQKTDQLPYLGQPLPLYEENTITIDHTTLSALEILKSPSGDPEATLFHHLNFTLTPMGRRLLQQWLTHPLMQQEAIQLRLSAVENLYFDNGLASGIRSELAQIRDLERLASKTALGLAMPRDLVAIREIQKRIPSLKDHLQPANAPLLQQIREGLDPLNELTTELEQALDDMPPANIRDGGIFRSSYQSDISEFRNLAHNAKSTIAGIERRERGRTQIPTLKVKFNKVFGYTIEVSKIHLGKVPADYIRKQTISTGERYITEELKTFEEKVITAEARLKKLEAALFLELRQQVASLTQTLLSNARRLAQLDGLLSFARAAREQDYVCPQIHTEWDLEIVEGRHPVVAARLPKGTFVPNSLSFSKENCQIIILTGPNMSGKSTVMRQIALITLMAQAGSFVPARSARLPVLDAIFTRIGSSDDLAHGRSTFMVEMTEMARILERATERSLILIDEIGRGTSTYDGLSLAWSLLEHLHTEVQAKTLFATHFHEVTGLEKSLPGIKNFNILVDKWKDKMVFLHKLSTGPCNRSFGIDVARLAKLPPKVLLRARDILGVLETHSQRANRARSKALKDYDNQLAFFEAPQPPESRPNSES